MKERYWRQVGVAHAQKHQCGATDLSNLGLRSCAPIQGHNLHQIRADLLLVPAMPRARKTLAL